MKLISMTDFVLDTKQNLEIGKDFVEVICNYANFLKQPLKLEYFIACDEDGNVLNDSEWKQYEGRTKGFDEIIQKHQQAKEKVLFEGFGIDYYNTTKSFLINYNNNIIGHYKSLPNYFVWNAENIEGLIDYNLTLTPNAIKQFNL